MSKLNLLKKNLCPTMGDSAGPVSVFDESQCSQIAEGHGLSGRIAHLFATNSRPVRAGHRESVSPTGARQRGNCFPKGMKQERLTALSLTLEIIGGSLLLGAALGWMWL